MNHRSSFVRLAVFAVLFSPTAMAAAQVPSFEPPVLLQPVDVPAPGGSARSLVAAKAGSGTWVTVWSGDFVNDGQAAQDQEILFSRSFDGGLTFSTQAALNSDWASDTFTFFDRIDGKRDWKPALAGDATGTLVALWQRRSAIYTDVMLARSTDAGQTWSAPALLNSDSYSPSIATDGAGTWIAMWTYSEEGGGIHNAIGFSRSTNSGQTWSPPARLFATGLGVAVMLFEARIAWAGGAWMLTWSNWESGTAERNAFYARSLDGTVWTPATTVAVVSGSDRHYELAPVTAGDNAGNWVMAWPAGANANGVASAIVASRSSDGGATWSAPQFLPAAEGSAQEWDVRIAASPSGTFVAVWNAYGGAVFGEDGDVFMSASTDLGETWSPADALNDATTDAGYANDFDAFVAHDPSGHWLAFWSSEDRRLASGTHRNGIDIVVSLGDHTCGNGQPDAGEACDTGRRGDLDCCNNVCGFDPSGIACAADDELCTLERCDAAGSCEHLAAPAATPCTSDDDLCSYDRCNASAVCEHVDAPREDCKVTLQAGASDLSIEVGSTPEEGALKWSWQRGEVTVRDDIGGYIGGRTYALCIYDADGLQARVEAPTAPMCSPENKSSCWRWTGNRIGTMRYKSRDGMPGGATKFSVKEGKELRSRANLAAKGAGFVPPTLPMSFPLRVQLNSDQACWEATYSQSEENSDTSFEATSD